MLFVLEIGAFLERSTLPDRGWLKTREV